MADSDKIVFEKGYDINIFTVKPADKFLCCHCMLILRNPVQSSCGHRYCISCFKTVCGELNEVECPACKAEGAIDPEFSIMKKDQMYPDMALRRELGRSQAKCINTGCSWTGEFKNYTEHESMCQFRGITCPVCKKNIAEAKLEDHKLNSCSKRKVKCSSCNIEVPFSESKEHSKTCPKVQMSCDACHKKFIRDQYTKHLEDECVRRIVQCPAGCTDLLRYDQLQTHIQKNLVSHVKYLLETIPQLKKQIDERVNALTAPSVVVNVERSINALTARIEALESSAGTSAIGASGGAAAGDDIGLVSRIASTELRLTAFEPIMGVLHKEIEKCIGIIEVMEQNQSEDTRTKEAYWKKVDDIEKQLKIMERSMTAKDLALSQFDLRFQSIELTRHDGTLIWKITGFQQKRSEALSGKTTSLYSPTFYTGHVGYKMCARLYPNGDGMGKGTHISLFFVMMRGHYDNLLPWPFKEKVTLMMIDQNMKEHIVDTFRPDTASSSFKKPDTEMNIASGCPLFLPLSRFEDPQYAYIKDDTMFVRILVDQMSMAKYDLNPLRGNGNFTSPPK